MYLDKNIEKQTKSDLDKQVVYEKVNKEINAWPLWKKMAYNEIFAVSLHARKINTE